MSLDVSDPSHPREVSRLTLGANEIPHWLGLEPGGDRVVITGYRELESRVVLARLDRATGALSLDTTFKSPGAAESGPGSWSGAVASRPIRTRNPPRRGIQPALSRDKRIEVS